MMDDNEIPNVENVVIKTEQESEWKSLSRIGPFKIFAAGFVVLFAIVFTFFITNRVTKIPKNAEAIILSCEERNKQLALVNEKFLDLTKFIDSVASRSSSGTFKSPEVIASLEKLKKSIPLVDCSNLIEE